MPLRAALPPRHAVEERSRASSRHLAGSCLIVLISLLPASARASAIAGYATDESIVQGGTLDLHVSTEAPGYDIVIEDALDPGIVLSSLTDLPGLSCAPPESAFALGCGWPVAASIPISVEWPSGVYYARLVSHAFGPNSPDTSFVPFVVREDVPGSVSPVLFQLSTTTYQAYNNWGGKSLYPQNSSELRRSYFVSFRRPYEQERGKGEFPWWERPIAAYLRSAGIPVEFCTNRDLHRDPNLLAPYKLFLSVGHDEYYSKPMYDALEAFRASGGNLAFFSGNSIFWQVRFEADKMVCYKDLDLDPYYPSQPDLVTINWRNPPLNRPEGFLMGVQFDNWCWRPCGAPLSVFEAQHWVTRGLGLDFATLLGTETVGYEWDRRFLGIEPPGIETIFQSLVWNHANSPRLSNGTFYQQPPEPEIGETTSRVFAAGTIQWGSAIRPDSAGADPRLQTITRRIVHCLSQPAELAADREVIFTADIRHASPAIDDTLWIRGHPAPLTNTYPGIPVLDDGVPPDAVAGDRIYSCSIRFPAGATDIVHYSYWTVGRCGFENYSAWIEDPELGESPVRIDNRPPTCPIDQTGVEDPATAQAPGFELKTAHRPDALEVMVSLPPGASAKGGRPKLQVDLFDVSGRLVRRLHRGEIAGEEATLRWSGRDSNGRQVASGVYVLRAQLGESVRSLKIVW